MPLRPQTLYPAHANQHPAVNGGNVAILSADNPRYPAEFQGEQALRDELDRLGLDYEVTKGRYGAPERSFIVINPDLTAVLDLGRRFGQESVAYSENGRHQLHFVNGPQAGMATTPSEKHQWHPEEPQDNYTAVPSPTGEPWGYFTWNIDFDSPLVPSSPTPMTQQQVAPMAKSEDALAVSIRKTLEALGELRTRELAKAEPPSPGPGVTAAPGVRIKPQVAAALVNVKRQQAPAAAPGAKFTQAPVTAGMSGRAAVLGMKKGEMREGSQVNIETNPFKKPDWKPLGTAMKSEYDAGSAVSMVQGDMTHVQSTHGTKKSESSDREHVRRVREAEDKELASVPLRDPNKGPWPQQSGKVLSIAEEKKMGKSESTKVDPLDQDISKQKHLCKMCKAEMSPVVAALRSKKGGVCLKCETGMAKGELKYHNNEPQYADNHWGLKGKEGYSKAPGSGGQVTKNPVGSSSNDGASSTTFPMKKAEPLAKTSVPGGQNSAQQHGVYPRPTVPIDHYLRERAKPKPASVPVAKAEGMPVPAAPKPPQAPGAKPSMAGGVVKAEGSADADLKKPADSPAQERFMQGIRHGWKPSHGKYKGKDLPSKTDAEKVLGMHKSEPAHMSLHKALREQVDLKKALFTGGGRLRVSAADPRVKTGAVQGSFNASKTAGQGAATGLPAAGKVQPKSPAEYDAAAFRPASPGAAGAPSGLELDTKPKSFAPGFKPTAPPAGVGGPGMAPPPLPKKQGTPIPKMTGIRGAPLSKPKV